MKVLFLNPPYGDRFCKSARWFARSRGRVQRHPDYLCQAIGVLEKSGHQCRLIDGAALQIGKNRTLQSLKEFKPEMVVIQGTTPSIYSDLEYARMCKEEGPGDCLTVMVGAHGSAEPADTLLKGEGGLDAAARGEYDFTLLELAEGGRLRDAGGLSYWDAGEVVHNPERPLLQGLDELPFPAWHHIDPRDYPDAGKLFPFLTLITGRGCAGRCTFCLFPQVMYGGKYRPMSVDRVIAELEHDLKLFPFLKEIMFEDDCLTLASQLGRLREICEQIIRRNIKISWSGNARADLTDLDTLKLMKRAGCRMLCVGFEFGDQQVLNQVKKGIKLERMRRFAHLAKKAGIRVHGCFMVGGPGETRQSALKTIDFASSLPIDTVQFSGVCAYPGTKFYQWVKDMGFLVPKDWPEWVDENGEQKSIVDYPQLSMGEINELIDHGLKHFYTRPRQMVRMLCNIRNVSDVRSKLHGLRSFIEYFWKNKQGSAI